MSDRLNPFRETYTERRKSTSAMVGVLVLGGFFLVAYALDWLGDFSRSGEMQIVMAFLPFVVGIVVCFVAVMLLVRLLFGGSRGGNAGGEL